MSYNRRTFINRNLTKFFQVLCRPRLVGSVFHRYKLGLATGISNTFDFYKNMAIYVVFHADFKSVKIFSKFTLGRAPEQFLEAKLGQAPGGISGKFERKLKSKHYKSIQQGPANLFVMKMKIVQSTHKPLMSL